MLELDQLRLKLNALQAERHSWRKTAAAIHPDLKPSMARLLANGYDPGDKIRRLLGLYPKARVLVMAGEPIPDGAQVLRATRCPCGRWFISNHPGRRHCFICRPFRGKAK